MIRHYLLSSLASIARAPLTTAANVFALALGLVCFLAAQGIVTYWTSADNYHRDAGRIAFISYGINAPGATKPRMMNQVAPAALARPLREDFPEIEFVVRAASSYNVALASGDRKTLAAVAYADPDFTRIFDFDFIEGGPEAALSDPNGVILTRETARGLFADGPALGRPVIVDGKQDATVTGVIAPVRQPSFMGQDGTATLRFDAIRPWTAQPDAERMENNWLGGTGHTLIKLKPGASLDAVRSRLPDFAKRRLPPSAADLAAVFVDAFPISRMTMLGIENQLSPGEGPKISAVALILGLGLLTLIVAGVNYANLATAQSLTRAKEVGMRKALGARRGSIMIQAWTETTILSLAAFVLALAALALAAPWARANLAVDLLYAWSAGPGAVALIFAIVGLTAFLAGAYPALKLSSARPAEALRSGRSRSGPRLVSRLLVVIQFASASFLLIMVTTMQLQRAEVARKALASHEDPIAVLNPIAPLDLDAGTLEQRLLSSPTVKDVTFVNFPPWDYAANVINLARSSEPAAGELAYVYSNVDHSYFNTLSLKILAGRVFERGRDVLPANLYTDSTSRTPPVVVDRLAAERLGFASPQEAVGKIIFVPESLRRGAGIALIGSPLPALPLQIIGVVETETSSMEASEVTGHVYSFGSELLGPMIPLVRFARDRLGEATAHTKRVWDELAPNIPLNLRFYDNLFEQHYRTYAQAGNIFLLLAGAAFVIATIGILGIAIHTATRRRHEIAVRKTLGSSVTGIVRLLLTDFSIPVLIGNLLSWPLGYLAAQAYLSAFADRIDLTPAPFLFSLLITIAIAWAAVIGVVLKTASVRPAEVLKHA